MVGNAESGNKCHQMCPGGCVSPPDHRERGADVTVTDTQTELKGVEQAEVTLRKHIGL